MSAQSAIFNPSQTTSAATGDGFSVPRLTTTGRLAITFGTSDKGMMVYDTTLNNLFIWNGSAWESVPASGDAGADGAVQYNDNGVVSGASNFTYNKTTSTVSATGLNVTGTTIPANGMYLGAANVLSFSAASALGFTLNSIGMGVNRTAATYRFEVFGDAQVIQSNFVDVALRISQGTATTGNKSQVLFTDSTGTISYVTGYGSAFGPPYNKALALGTNGADRVLVDSNGNVAIGVGAFTFGTSAAGVLGLANATAPSTSPAGMGQLYVEAGSLKYRGTSGLVTILALA